MNPLVQDLIKSLDLNEHQAAGAIGLVLSQLRKYLPLADFATLQKFMPDIENLIKQAPEVHASFLGGLANSLGGDKAKALLEINKGLNKLNIPTRKQKELADTLKSSVARHYPDLAALIEL